MSPVGETSASLRAALEAVSGWPVARAAAAVVEASGTVLAAIGDIEHRFRLASITKALFAYAALVAVEEGSLRLDEPAGPPGSTVRHLLAHASGLAFREARSIAAPGSRRIYSNAGFEELGRHLARATGISEADYLDEAVFAPLGMRSSRLAGSPAAWAVSSVADLCRWLAELWQPRLLAPATLDEATRVQFPELNGVLPGLGRQRPNPWGLGFEIRGHKDPHWTAARNDPATFGHFGGSGTFFWVDRRAGLALVALTDREFGPWALAAWPALADAVLEAGAAPIRDAPAAPRTAS